MSTLQPLFLPNTGHFQRRIILLNSLPFRRGVTGPFQENRTSSYLSSIVQKASDRRFAEVEGDNQQLWKYINAEKWTKASSVVVALLSAEDGEADIIDSMLLDRLLQGLCLKNHARRAIKLYTKLKSDQISLSSYTFHVLFQAALKEGAFNLVRKMYHDTRRSGCSFNRITYSMVITGLLKDKRKGSSSWQLAYEIWMDAKTNDLKLDAGFFRAGCGACVSVRKMQEAEELIPIMRQQGFRPDERFYNILIKGYCRMLDMKSALRCFEDMKKEDIVASKITYNTLIHGFVLCKELEKGERMLKFALREGYQPDVWSYTTLINGYLQKDQIQKATQLYEEFKSNGGKPNEVTHSIFMNNYIDQGNITLAYKRLKLMKQEGLKPNLIIFNTLLKGYATHGTLANCQDIIKLLVEMKENGIRPEVDTFNTLLGGLMDSRDVKVVKMVLQEMVRLGIEPDGVSYNFLMKMSANDFENIFQQMQDSENCHVDLVCWNLLVTMFCGFRNLQKAEEALTQVKEFAQYHNYSLPVEAYTAIIKAYIDQGELPAAIKKFREFCNLGGQPDGPLIELLLKACINKGDTYHALKLLRVASLLDKDLDLNKYRKLVMRREQASFKKNAQRKEKEEGNFETLKFWLGIPNQHYSSDWP